MSFVLQSFLRDVQGFVLRARPENSRGKNTYKPRRAEVNGDNHRAPNEPQLSQTALELGRGPQSGPISEAELIRSLVGRMFRIFRGPFEAVRADYRVSRRGRDELG